METNLYKKKLKKKKQTEKKEHEHEYEFGPDSPSQEVMLKSNEMSGLG